MAIDIDLRDYRDLIRQFISESISRHVSQHPDMGICTIGLFGDGFHGRASLYLDTPDHCQSYVAEWDSKGAERVSKGYPDLCGKDPRGRFCANTADFPYCIGHLRFLDYPNLYENTARAPIDFVTLEGKAIRVPRSAGDEGLHRVVSPFLKTVLRTFEPFSELTRVPPFRAGVHMPHTICGEFWPVDVS